MRKQAEKKVSFKYEIKGFGCFQTCDAFVHLKLLTFKMPEDKQV